MQAKAQFETDSTARDENLKCWHIGNNPLCLRIELNDGTEFILPYGYFEGAKFVRGAESEDLHLQFKTSRFVIKGKVLGELFAAFQTLSVEWLKSCPPRYRTLTKTPGFIEEIEISKTQE